MQPFSGQMRLKARPSVPGLALRLRGQVPIDAPLGALMGQHFWDRVAFQQHCSEIYFPHSCFPLEKHILICTANFLQQFLTTFSGDFYWKQF